MALQRRQFLLLLGGGVGGMLLNQQSSSARPLAGVPFKPVATPLPLPGDGLSVAQQRQAYGVVRISDRLVLPKGYGQKLLASWGEPVGNSRFGFNNDYLALRQLSATEALLTVNFEYISPIPWSQSFASVVGTALPYASVVAGLKASNGRIDAWALPAGDPLAAAIRELAREALIDQGLGVIRLKRGSDGWFQRDPGPEDRRITGLAGLNNPSQQLRCTGPAAAVFRLPQRQGYNDGLGDRIIGSFANCAGGTTPWGTVLSAEENFQSQVPEAVFADGSPFPPSARPFQCTSKELNGLGNPFGLAGNKYGWMVEINPANSADPGTKHTALGRFRHEAVAVQAQAGKPLTVYSGCDRRGGHLYRFVSDGLIKDPSDPANSQLFASGRLYGAVFNANGSGEWRALQADTPVAPLAAPVLVPHSDRDKGGSELLQNPEQVKAYATRYRSLGDLYRGSGDAQLGALLIDAHYAANAAGITGTARPEDTEIDPRSGDLLIVFTSGLPGEEGIPDPSIFKGPRGQTPWNEGWIMRLKELGNQRFSWRMVATGGEPADGGLGFANPDNLAVDPNSDALWMVTDIGTGELNGDRNGGNYGNNSCWVIPTAGPAAGKAYCFATGPMECELTGVTLDASGSSLFLAVQHPGELNGIRRDGAEEARGFPLRLSDGSSVNQLRWVPLGSNWPQGEANAAPKPSVLEVRRSDGKPLLALFS
jgi:secreted PhoX family phosphatase